MRARLRGLFPPPERYELFDNGVFVAVVLIAGYVLTFPSPVAADALRGPFMLAPVWFWGGLIGTCGFVAAACSYSDNTYAFGRRLLLAATTFWSGCFLAGWVVWDAPARSLVTALIYAWVASRLWRLDPDT